MRLVYLCLVQILLILLACASCHKNNGSGTTPGLPIPVPNATVFSQLPQFMQQANEIEIADSMNDIDPTWVLGAIVDVRTGKVRGLDSFLAPDAKPEVTPQTEVLFKDLIENSVALDTSWLAFLSAKVNDKVRAELSVIKTSKVTMNNKDVQRDRLVQQLNIIPQGERENYGLIIGYVDFVLSATLFKDFGTEAGASGYGVKINGKWFTRFENTSAHHRVIAIWSPLPFVVDEVKDTASPKANLESATLAAIKSKNLQITRPAKPVEVRNYVKTRGGILHVPTK